MKPFEDELLAHIFFRIKFVEFNFYKNYCHNNAHWKLEESNKLPNFACSIFSHSDGKIEKPNWAVYVIAFSTNDTCQLKKFLCYFSTLILKYIYDLH